MIKQIIMQHFYLTHLDNIIDYNVHDFNNHLQCSP